MMKMIVIVVMESQLEGMPRVIKGLKSLNVRCMVETMAKNRLKRREKKEECKEGHRLLKSIKRTTFTHILKV